MTEHLKRSHESGHEQPGNKEHSERQKALHEAAEQSAKSSRHEHAENIESIRSSIEAASKSKQESISKNKEKTKESPVLVNKELKALAYKRTLHRVQRKLPAPSRVFSKMVHYPVIETTSEVVGKTVARPSGVLAGGFFAFLGSSLFLYITKHYGYEYNYLLFTLFFVGGFFVGLLVELGLKLSNRKSR